MRRMNSHRDYPAFDYWKFASEPLSPLDPLQLWVPFGSANLVAEDWNACVPSAMIIVDCWLSHLSDVTVSLHQR